MKRDTFTPDRTDHIRMARIYLAQTRHFRQHAGFHCLLMSWARKHRLLASVTIDVGQMDLFGIAHEREMKGVAE